MERKAKLTVKELSKQTGVSASTISRVVNHPNLVNENTRNEVLAKLNKIGYSIPKANKKSNNLIGITISDPCSAFSQTVVANISKLLTDTEYQVLQFNIKHRQNIYDYFSKHIDYLKKIDALVVTSAIVDEKAKEFFESYNIPIVLLQTRCEGEFSIHNNNFSGCQLAAKYILSRGYTDIAFVGWQPNDEHIYDRYMGFTSVLKAKGIPLKKDYYITSELSKDGGYLATKKLLKLDSPPQVIFYGCDDMAAGGYKYLQEQHLKVPQDVGIMGFDNLAIAELLDLTTMDQSIDRKCQLATNYLLSRLRNNVSSNYTDSRDEISITPKLIVRSTLK